MIPTDPKKEDLVEPNTIVDFCSCGRPHPRVPIKKYVGQDAFDALAYDSHTILKGRSALIVDDQNTHAVAGQALAKAFQRQNVRFHTLILPGDVSATAAQAEALIADSRGYDLMIAVGSGTINDLAKYAAGKRGIPYRCVPTAPSMNGYTSSIAAIKVAGVKRTLPSPPPHCLYVRPEVICQAPLRLRQAGFCDVMAKSVSDIDWQVESLLFSGTYCGLPSHMVDYLESGYRDHPDLIREGDRRVVMGLLDGLLVSGVAMSVVGSSAPASGGEHLVSHFLDMRETLTGRKPDFHGLQVAIGIVLSASCYWELASLKADELPNQAHDIFKKDGDLIGPVWKEMAPEIAKRFMLKRDWLLQLDDGLEKRWAAVQALCQKVPAPEYYAALMRKTGFALTLEEVRIPAEEFLLAARMARTIRERITVLDISAQAGVLEKAAAKTLELLKKDAA